MKQLLLFCALLLSPTLWAEKLTVKVGSAGQLSASVTPERIKQYSRVVITGDLNGSDILFLRTNLKKGSGAIVEVLDLSDARIVSGGSYDDGLGKLSVHPFSNLIAEKDVIGNGMFNEFSTLTELILPTQLKEIKDWSFRSCSRLQSLTIPEGVSKIGTGICENDNAIVEIALPSTLKSIGADAFSYCRNLDKVVCLSKLPPVLGSNVFSSSAPKSLLTVPAGSKEIYAAAEQWADFQTIAEAETPQAVLSPYASYLKGRVAYAGQLVSDEHIGAFSRDGQALESFVQALGDSRSYLGSIAAGGEDTLTTLSKAKTLDAAILSLLDQNATDLQEYYGIKDLVFRGLTSKPVSSQEGYWRYSGGRWMNPVPEEEGFRSVVSYIQGSYDLPDSKVYLDLGSLPPGEYMFSVCLRGYLMQGSSATERYTPDGERAFYGVKIWQNDKVVDCGELPHDYYGTYTVFGHVDGEDSVKVGVEFVLPAEYRGQQLGGRFFVADPQVRYLGGFSAAVMHWADLVCDTRNAVRQLADQADQQASQWKWGVENLESTAAKARQLCERSLAYVDSEGLVQVYSEDIAVELSAQSVELESLLRSVAALNRPYEVLAANISEAQTVIDGGEFTLSPAERLESLQAVLGESRELWSTYGVLDSESAQDESAKYAATSARLLKALTHYKMGAAVYANHQRVGMSVENAVFSENATDGWTLTANDPSREDFRQKASGEYHWEHGTGAVVWRGTSVAPASKLVQQLTVSEPGVYRYRSGAFAYNEAKYIDLYMLNIADGDTLYDNSRVRMFFGPAGRPDSVCVHSHYFPGSNHTLYTGKKASKYNVVYVKTTADEEVLEFGMDASGQAAMGNSGANTYGFSDNEVLFGGEAVAFAAAAKADLRARIAEAESLCAANLESADAKRAGQAKRLERIIRHAKAAADGESLTDIFNAMDDLSEACEDLDVSATGRSASGIETVGVSARPSASSALYDLQGRRLTGMPQRGLYIQNGRKYIAR